MKKKLKIEVRTNYGNHVCVFEKDPEKGGYIVVANNLQGVVTWGKNLSEAKKMAREAIELCIECSVEECLHGGEKRLSRVPANV
jgi:predicted RNase H-like HicB family nuclease